MNSNKYAHAGFYILFSAGGNGVEHRLGSVCVVLCKIVATELKANGSHLHRLIMAELQ